MQDDRLIESVYVWNYGRNEQARKTQERAAGRHTRVVQYGHVDRLQLLQGSTKKRDRWLTIVRAAVDTNGH